MTKRRTQVGTIAHVDHGKTTLTSTLILALSGSKPPRLPSIAELYEHHFDRLYDPRNKAPALALGEEAQQQGFEAAIAAATAQLIATAEDFESSARRLATSARPTNHDRGQAVLLREKATLLRGQAMHIGNLKIK
jgi:hypothetical protein